MDAPIGWQDLRHGAASQLVPNDDRPLLLQPASRRGGLWLLAIGLLSGRTVILDERQLFEADAQGWCRLSDADLPAEWLHGDAVIEAEPGWTPGDMHTDACWILATSGSTGSPKLIEKSVRGLLAETQDLARLYRLQGGQKVLSLVSPLHIYGLLHAFFLPLVSSCEVQFYDFGTTPWPPPMPAAWDLVIAVPALWHFVEQILDSQDVGTLVMSGAPFGNQRQTELMSRSRRPSVAYEILGSTETGGIGFRSLLSPGDIFTAMPSVTFAEAGDQQVVRSPYLWPKTEETLADNLEILDSGQFRHLGRIDRIFKYAGQRYSLAELENLLRRISGSEDVVVRFHSDPNIAQGGWLEAWIAKDPPMPDEALRRLFREQSRAPFPHRLHQMSELPRDSQGKIQIRVK